MEVFDAVRTVLAVRSYRSDPVPDDVVHKMLEAARLSASASNRQPWNFVVVRDPGTLKELGRLVTTGPYIADAPLAVVVAVERTGFAFSDASRAIQSMVLTAWADGVGSNWAGGPGMDQVKELLGIPDDLDVVAVLPFGYPAQAAGQGKKTRKPLGEIAHRERFGQPFE
jgi:nitroreductase